MYSLIFFFFFCKQVWEKKAPGASLQSLHNVAVGLIVFKKLQNFSETVWRLHCETICKIIIEPTDLFIFFPFSEITDPPRWVDDVSTPGAPWGLMMRSCHTVTMRRMTNWKRKALKGKKRHQKEHRNPKWRQDPLVSYSRRAMIFFFFPSGDECVILQQFSCFITISISPKVLIRF